MEYKGDTGDPYVDPEIGILKNLAGIRDAALLEEYEGEMSIIRQFELSENPPASSFDFDHLRAIHRQLFQDVYAWAGEPRSVDMAKGSSRFGSHLYIEKYLSKAFVQLAAERQLWRNSPEAVDWAERFSHYLGEINAVHPFREGNGRAQRLFIGLLAQEHGFEIRWDRMTAPEMVAASIASFDGDSEPLKLLIQKHLIGKS
jgi:cell filamentation protein